jgi:hypothetical protein
MMFTQLEKIEQKRLMKKGADHYTVEVSNDITKETQIVSLYAESEEHAIMLSRRLSKRSENNLMTDLNFNLKEIKDNKLGLILPWKDPVNKRSVNTAIKMPLKRSKNIVKDILVAAKGTNSIEVSSLTDEQLLAMKTSCLKNNFVSLMLLIVGIYIYFSASTDGVNILSIALCAVVSITTYIKTRRASQIIKIEEITREHLWKNN